METLTTNETLDFAVQARQAESRSLSKEIRAKRAQFLEAERLRKEAEAARRCVCVCVCV